MRRETDEYGAYKKLDRGSVAGGRYICIELSPNYVASILSRMCIGVCVRVFIALYMHLCVSWRGEKKKNRSIEIRIEAYSKNVN